MYPSRLSFWLNMLNVYIPYYDLRGYNWMLLAHRP